MLPVGTERLKNTGLHLEHDKIGEFWRWAFGDLKANSIRGVLAEWMVGRILGLPVRKWPCDPWAECDLKTDDGFRIEVKAGGYLQTWEQNPRHRLSSQASETRPGARPMATRGQRPTTRTSTPSACRPRRIGASGTCSTLTSGGSTCSAGRNSR